MGKNGIGEGNVRRREDGRYSDDMTRLHLNRESGDERLADLDRKSIKSRHARKRESLSAARVERIHGVLAASLNVAVRWGSLGLHREKPGSRDPRGGIVRLAVSGPCPEGHRPLERPPGRPELRGGRAR